MRSLPPFLSGQPPAACLFNSEWIAWTRDAFALKPYVRE